MPLPHPRLHIVVSEPFLLSSLFKIVYCFHTEAFSQISASLEGSLGVSWASSLSPSCCPQVLCVECGVICVMGGVMGHVWVTVS